LIVVPQTNQWQKLKALVLDSVSSPITKRVYNHALDEFFEWFGQEPRPGFTKATVADLYSFISVALWPPRSARLGRRLRFEIRLP
jgi:predicted phosphoadenosine phosphosulfate sulfurtransferase